MNGIRYQDSLNCYFMYLCCISLAMLEAHFIVWMDRCAFW